MTDDIKLIRELIECHKKTILVEYKEIQRLLLKLKNLVKEYHDSNVGCS